MRVKYSLRRECWYLVGTCRSYCLIESTSSNLSVTAHEVTCIHAEAKKDINILRPLVLAGLVQLFELLEKCWNLKCHFKGT